MMTQVRLLKSVKGLPAGTVVWAKTVTEHGMLHTLWQTPYIKVYLGSANLDSGVFEVVEGVPHAYAIWEPTNPHHS